MLKNRYSKAMLPNVNYEDLESEEAFEEIIGLEYETMRNLYSFTEELRDILLQEKMAQTLELMVAHLCAYLGFMTVASLGIKQATTLEIEIVKLLEEQAKTAYDIFCKYPVSSSLSPEEQTKNLDQLRKNSPGSLVVQTIRLGSFVWGSILELANNRKLHIGFAQRKQAEFFCPQNTFIALLERTASRTINESKNGMPITYILNQMTMQLGWLMGYYGHLNHKFPTTYLEYGKPCIQLYIDFGHKFLDAIRLAKEHISND
jgi:hypothetical protein